MPPPYNSKFSISPKCNFKLYLTLPQLSSAYNRHYFMLSNGWLLQRGGTVFLEKKQAFFRAEVLNRINKACIYWEQKKLMLTLKLWESYSPGPQMRIPYYRIHNFHDWFGWFFHSVSRGMCCHFRKLPRSHDLSIWRPLDQPGTDSDSLEPQVMGYIWFLVYLIGFKKDPLLENDNGRA